MSMEHLITHMHVKCSNIYCTSREFELFALLFWIWGAERDDNHKTRVYPRDYATLVVIIMSMAKTNTISIVSVLI